MVNQLVNKTRSELSCFYQEAVLSQINNVFAIPQVTIKERKSQPGTKDSLSMELKEYLSHTICGLGTFRTERHLAYCAMPKRIIDTVIKS